MNKNILFVLVSISVLSTMLIVGTPFEFLNSTTDTVATYVIAIIVLAIFVFTFRRVRFIINKYARWFSFALVSILLAIYLWIGTWTIVFLTGSNHPMWEDVSVLTDQQNHKIISQIRRTSGSLFDYRHRFIIADFGNIRISFNCNVQNLNGTWSEYDIEKKTTTNVYFDDQN